MQLGILNPAGVSFPPPLTCDSVINAGNKNEMRKKKIFKLHIKILRDK